MWLLLVAAVGLFLPGGLFLWWLFSDYTSLAAALADKLALAFAIDLLGTTALIAWLFARRPPGPVRWPWFVILSLGGTLWFGIPIYLWLNWRRAPAPRPDFVSWWRAA